MLSGNKKILIQLGIVVTEKADSNIVEFKKRATDRHIDQGKVGHSLLSSIVFGSTCWEPDEHAISYLTLINHIH